MWFIILWAPFLFAQNPYHYSIGRNQGLMVESIYHIYEDAQGFIWLATNDGLMRYDGFHFKLYESKGQTSKSGNHILQDNQGQIWYQTFDGYLYHTSGDSLVGINQTRPLGWREFEIIDDHLFLFSDYEMNVYSISQEKWIKKIPLNFNIMLGMWKVGKVLHCLSHELLTIDENLNVSIQEVESDPKKYMPVIGCDQGRNYHFVSKVEDLKKLYEFQENQIVAKAELKEVSFVQNLYKFENLYWVCAPEGLYIYTSKGELVGGAPIFKGKNVACAFLDKWGRYWIGTMNEGLLVIEDMDARFYECAPEQIATVNGELIIGGKAGNLYALGENGELSLRYKSNSSHGISYLEYDTAYHQIYFVDQFLNVLDEHFHKVLDFRLAVKDIVRLDEKYLAVAASGGVGFFRLGSEKLKSDWDVNFEKIEWIEDDRWRYFLACRGKSIVRDPSKKQLFFTSNIGTHTFSDLGVKEVKYKNEPIYLQRLYFYKDHYYGLSSEGKLWRSDSQLQNMELFLPKEFTDRIKRIRQVDGYLFVNDNKQLRYYDLSNWKIGSKSVKNWAGQEALNDLLLLDNHIYAALDHGILRLAFQQEQQTHESPFYVLSIKVNGKLVHDDQLTELDYLENNVEINYAVLSFLPSTSEPVYYSINEGEWKQTASGSRSLRLESLSPGSYTIRFKIGESICDQQVQVDIDKPFWLKWWFIGGVACIVLAIVFLYYRYRTTNLRRQNRLLNEKIILEKNLHKATMKSIKSQMNPHFFYNALNTIQSFIFTDDKRRASTYLAKFSKLTRIILEMSDKERISLTEEMQALELYLEIEQVRFDDDFAFEIAVDPNLDVELVNIPSMIIQPYVENAIKHGLLHKKGPKLIHLSFLSESGMLVVVIDDNGVGRKKSEELNAIKNKGHRGFATEANYKRLEILNKTNERMGVEFIDKYDDNHLATGTKVIIRIPL